jgi:hypothetical protein
MEPAVKASLLWGLVGALSFLVLLQGYHLLVEEFVGFGVMIGVAAVVFGVTAVSAHLLRPVVAHRNKRT